MATLLLVQNVRYREMHPSPRDDSHKEQKQERDEPFNLEEGPAESCRPQLIKRAKQKTLNYLLSDKTKLLPSDKEEEIKDLITGLLCSMYVQRVCSHQVRQVESRNKFLTLKKTNQNQLYFIQRSKSIIIYLLLLLAYLKESGRWEI